MGNTCSAGAHDAAEVPLDSVASAPARRRPRGSRSGAATGVATTRRSASTTTSRSSHQSRRDHQHQSRTQQGRRSTTSTAPPSATSTDAVSTRQKRERREEPVNPFSDAPLAGSVDALHSSDPQHVAFTPTCLSPFAVVRPVLPVEPSDAVDETTAAFEALSVAAVDNFPDGYNDVDDNDANLSFSSPEGAGRRMGVLFVDDDAAVPVLPAVPDFDMEPGGAEPSLVSYAASRQPSQCHPQLQQHRHRGSSVHGGGGTRCGSSASRAGFGSGISQSFSTGRGQQHNNAHPLRPPSTRSSSSGQPRGASSGRSFMTASSYFAPSRCGGGSSEASVRTTTTTTPASVPMSSVATPPR